LSHWGGKQERKAAARRSIVDVKDVTTVLYDGYAGAIRQTMTIVRGQHRPGVVSESERRGLQRLVEATVALGSNMKRDMARGWEYLFAGQVEDPQSEGKVLAWALEHTRAIITEVEEGFREMQARGWVRLDLTPLELARKEIDREIERFREGWPYISPEEVAAIEARTDADYMTREEFAGGMATSDQP
jgi:hypothetical protein